MSTARRNENNPEKTPWLRYTLLTLLLLVMGVIAVIIYSLFIYDPFATWEVGRIEPMLSESLRPTAEYLYANIQPTPPGMGGDRDVSLSGEICFLYLQPTADERVDLELYLNGSLVPYKYYAWDHHVSLTRDPRLTKSCIDSHALKLPSGLHLMELHMTRQGYDTQVYQWAVKME